jgi:hypothetical protein
MGQHLKDTLGKVLDGYDERRRAVLEREQQQKAQDAAFLQRFAELRASVIRPVFEEAGAVLAARGHGFSVTEQEFTSGLGTVAEAAITLRIAPAGMASPMHDDHGRSFSISTRHYNKTVWINSGRAMAAGGIAGSKGAQPLEEVTREAVEEALIRFVGEVVAA